MEDDVLFSFFSELTSVEKEVKTDIQPDGFDTNASAEHLFQIEAKQEPIIENKPPMKRIKLSAANAQVVAVAPGKGIRPIDTAGAEPIPATVPLPAAPPPVLGQHLQGALPRAPPPVLGAYKALQSDDSLPSSTVVMEPPAFSLPPLMALAEHAAAPAPAPSQPTGQQTNTVGAFQYSSPGLVLQAGPKPATIQSYQPLAPAAAKVRPAQQTIPVPRPAGKNLRVGAGKVWNDPTLDQWPDGDFRLFCGDLGNDTTDQVLANAFKKYPSFVKAKIVREKWNSKSKGYGFVSFMDPFDCMKALREVNGKYIGNRPVKLRKSNWQERNLKEVRKKEKKKKKLEKALGIA